MNNKPVAYVNSMCNDYIDWKVEPMSIDGKSLYTHPVKYCPSESNEAYEKGFIDGMAKMTESAVHRAVEGMAVKELTDEEILCLWDWWSGEILSTDILDFADTYKRVLLGEEGLLDWHKEYVKKMNEQYPLGKAQEK